MSLSETHVRSVTTGPLAVFTASSGCSYRPLCCLPACCSCLLPASCRGCAVLDCRQPNVQVSQRQLTVREIVSGHASGRLLEVFGSGTACVVQPVGCVVMAEGRELDLPASAAAVEGGSSRGAWGPDGAPSVADWARRVLTDIQYGRVPGHPWSVSFD